MRKEGGGVGEGGGGIVAERRLEVGRDEGVRCVERRKDGQREGGRRRRNN